MAVNARYIYWANDYTIGRASLNGTDVNQRFITGTNVPAGLALTSDHIYWTNEYGNTIGRANLDGTDINERFITGANRPEP